MLRRVLYDPAWPAAAAAAALLGDEYDVQAAPSMAASEAAAIILTGDVRTTGGERTRVIGVVDLADPGPWPEGWYTLVPAGSARPLVARAVANAYADLEAA